MIHDVYMTSFSKVKGTVVLSVQQRYQMMTFNFLAQTIWMHRVHILNIIKYGWYYVLYIHLCMVWVTTCVGLLTTASHEGSLNRQRVKCHREISLILWHLSYIYIRGTSILYATKKSFLKYHVCGSGPSVNLVALFQSALLRKGFYRINRQI